MADQYPLFNANDIIVSCRSLSAIFVIDVETERIKWLYSVSTQSTEGKSSDLRTATC